MSNYLDRYGRNRSLCHRLPPRLKLLLTLGVVLAGVSIPVKYWPAHGVLMSLVFIGHSVAHVPLSYLARRLAIFMWHSDIRVAVLDSPAPSLNR